MKRSALLRHLRACGCVVVREGASHTVVANPANGKKATLPRHVEIPENFAKLLCRQLGIEFGK